ncbi:bZIP transcription factor (MeaB) [Drepanopeziza brunnea f. sp. 'multigermtubi' MB_m1]|uniref:BZIP transcription factor (MeaB) n=1 Tax=Marssonina brunnea f. sp. multigermtubi (strain MB_m1) TaxID=1072389 RepID=K1WRK0_MARBU|nr:bZIP transcription factor (MeaB) [Drepanopeziza brunnea f. sp. 'multigermtubi' MB_m1]EKD15042.1 bZIP transcription factor (MeaB) [Drepanopeziza brunnea f. sp. 'multigermtubi' MB_m1]
MSECGNLQRTQSVEDEDHGHRGSSASSPPALPLKKGRGGRKVMFPSAEEKKQRNRDSQAAFRERRKEHIAELEQVVQDQKEKLQESQRAQASAKEEVLVLKYKNSLLERILLEQGIDVNAELNNILVFPPRIPEKRARMERPLLRKQEVAPVAATHPPSSFSNSSSSSTVPQSQPQPQIRASPATTWAPTPPLPLDVAAENETFGLDLDFEADFTFGGMMAGAGEKFDLDLGFLSSVHV